MEFISLCRKIEIGSNSFVLRCGDQRLVLDCGQHPTERGELAVPEYPLIPSASLDAIVITHAHQDHLGSLPVLTRREPQAAVFLTEPTAHLAQIMLHNSVNVMMHQQKEENLPNYPLFQHRGVDRCKKQWQTLPVGGVFNWQGDLLHESTSEPTLEFFHAGHILGSVGVKIGYEGKTLFYTGDVNFEHQTLMKPAQFPTDGIDILIMETTRGDSESAHHFTRAGEEERFGQAIEAAFSRNSSITMPVFAVGKTQEMLALLWRLKQTGDLPNFPIFIGGLSTKVTTVYDLFAQASDRSQSQLQLLSDVAPNVVSGNQIDTLSPKKHHIFALSSGMMTEKTLSNRWMQRILPNPKHSVFFVGYSDPESPAGRVRAAQPGDAVVLDPLLPPFPLRCQVEEFNFSAHSSREALLAYACQLKPKKILLVHGDIRAVQWFKTQLNLRLPHTEVLIPEPGSAVEL